MILYSRHLWDIGMPIPPEAVIRINFAWYNRDTKIPTSHDLFMDFPKGRKKPPKPKWTLKAAVEFANKMPRVKYFAISNAEDYESMWNLRRKLYREIKIVPKIETVKGVYNLAGILSGADSGMCMLDTEDLYKDAHDLKTFEEAMKFFRMSTPQVEVLELQGVVFVSSNEQCSGESQPTWV